MTKLKIDGLKGREVLDSRGFPTVEVDLIANGRTYSAIVPSGASTGEGEALELRDQDKKRYHGKGVLKAVSHVNSAITGAVVGKSFDSLKQLDDALLSLDGTANKSKLGANAILPVSMAACRAFAESVGMPLYRYLANIYETVDTRAPESKAVTLPVPLMNVINGGKHADNGLAIQEFMIVPLGFETFSEALRAGSEVFHTLKKIIHDKGLSTGVGDEGGFAPQLAVGQDQHKQVLELLMLAIEKSGYKPRDQIALALDCAASEFSSKASTNASVAYDFEGKSRSGEEMISIYKAWAKQFPIVSIEDGFSEHDWDSFSKFQADFGSQIQIVGDDLFVTNVEFLKKGIEHRAANSILIKLNQIGTVTETLKTMSLARSAGFTQIASHRSGESEDAFIADLAVGTDCGQIKTGSLSRSDRLAKYNQLLRIEEQLGKKAQFAGRKGFGLR